VELTSFIINNLEEFNANEMDAIYFQRSGNPVCSLANKKKLEQRQTMLTEIAKSALTDMEKEEQRKINDNVVCIYIDITDARNCIHSFSAQMERLSQNDMITNIFYYGIPIRVAVGAAVFGAMYGGGRQNK
jgi:uncharacterized protein YkuJ